MTAEDKKLRPLLGKGWSLINILTGLAFIIAGYCMVLIVLLAFFWKYGWQPTQSSRWVGLYALENIAFAMMIFGALGWWLVIPAFQTWRHSKRWLVWTLLVIAIALALYCLAFLNSSILHLSL